MKCPKCKSEDVASILYGFPVFDSKLEKDLEGMFDLFDCIQVNI